MMLFAVQHFSRGFNYHHNIFQMPHFSLDTKVARWQGSEAQKLYDLPLAFRPRPVMGQTNVSAR